MLQPFLQQLPKEVFVISENGKTRNSTDGTVQGSATGSESCKGQEIDEDEWSEEDFDAIEIDVVQRAEGQRRERKKIMCKQLRQVQGKVALRKKEKAKGVATKTVDSKQKANKENKE